MILMLAGIVDNGVYMGLYLSSQIADTAKTRIITFQLKYLLCFQPRLSRVNGLISNRAKIQPTFNCNISNFTLESEGHA